jgi:signal transduction histidine kinase
MGYEMLVALFDIAGAIGFLVAVWIGAQNYRATDVERPFWMAFSVTAALGAIWLALVAAEWLGSSSAVLDQFNTSLQAVVIGLYAIAVVGMYAVVEELKQSRRVTTDRAVAVSVLSRVLRHNLRNDLTVIRGYVSVLSDESSNSEAVHKIQETIDNLLETSEKARTFERTLVPQAHYEQVDLADLVSRVVWDLSAEYPAATISVDRTETETIPVMPSFRTALIELVENAVEHGGDPPVVEVDIRQDGATTVVRVTDNGTGLPPEEQTLLNDDIETPLSHSRGIGLWIARRIAESHGGTISVGNSNGGTTLSIVIPSSPSELSGQRDERDLLQSPTERYYAVFEHDVDANLIVDDEQRIVDANAAAGSLLGTSSADLLGRPLPKIFAEDSGIDVDWQELEPGQVRRGTVRFSGEGSTERLLYFAVPNVVLGEHLLIVRRSEPTDASA